MIYKSLYKFPSLFNSQKPNKSCLV
jgi:hypothetical protein